MLERLREESTICVPFNNIDDTKLPVPEVRVVDVELVITDDVAKIFCVYRLRNLSVEEPRDPPKSEFGVMLPATCSLSVGVEVPMPMLPFARIVKSVEPDEDATVSRFLVDVPCIKSEEFVCVDVPILITLFPASANNSG